MEPEKSTFVYDVEKERGSEVDLRSAKEAKTEIHVSRDHCGLSFSRSSYDL